MKNIIFYSFILIFTYLVIVYFKGTSAVGSTISNTVGQSILFLQGRSDNGNQTNYPQS